MCKKSKKMVSVMLAVLLIFSQSAFFTKVKGEELNTVRVDDFGAIPNDSTDDGPAIRSAISAAAQIGPGTSVIFSAGTYRIETPAPDSPLNELHAFYNYDIAGISLIGNNTEILICDSFMDTFYFNKCSDITVKGFTIDYETAPWVQGQVTAVDTTAGTFDLVVEDGYTILDDPRWKQAALVSNPDIFGTVRDPQNPYLLKKDVNDYFKGFKSLEKLDSSTYRIGLGGSYAGWVGQYIVSGDKIVINNRKNPQATVRFRSCTNIDVEDCTIYASSGTAFVGGYSYGYARINNVKVLRKPGSGRWLTTNADGLFMQDMKGPVQLTNCVFEGLSDDCVNLHYAGLTLNNVYSPTSIQVTGRQVPQVGDVLEVFDPINGCIKGRATVTGFQLVQHLSELDDRAILTLDKPIAGMVAGANYKTGDTVYNVNAMFPGTIIENNIFRETRRLGVKLNTVDSVVRYNTFQNLGGPAIISMNYPEIPEGPGCSNLVIENNNIDNAAFLYQYAKTYDGAPLIIKGCKLTEAKADGIIHRNIYIRNNTINHTSKHGIYIDSAENVQLLDNTICGFTEDASETGLYLDNVNNVTVQGQNIINPSETLNCGIWITDQCSNVSLLSNTFNLATNVTQVFDENLATIWAAPALVEKGKWEIKVGIKNKSLTATMAGKLTITAPSEIAREILVEGLLPGQEKVIELPVTTIPQNDTVAFKSKLDLYGDNFGFSAACERNISFLSAEQAVTSPEIDGDIGIFEWGDAMSFDISRPVISDYGGADDVSATGWLKWDSANLYIAVKVKDNVQFQSASGSGIWQGDGLQMSIDPNRSDEPLKNNWNEFGFALGNDGSLSNWRWRAIPGKTVGALAGANYLIKRDESCKTTSYEIAIPWSELLLDGMTADNNMLIGFSMLVNDNDGTGRRGWIEYMSGIGTKKDPNAFGDLILAPRPAADKTPPVTIATLTGTNRFNGSYNSNVTISFTASDYSSGSGVEKTEYSFDGTNWLQYSTPVIISDDGETTISFRSCDTAGNMETAHSIIINIDKTPDVMASDLIRKINGINLEQETRNSLVLKLEEAQSYIVKGDKYSAISQIEAFINEIDALVGGKLTSVQANELKATAYEIINSINLEPTLGVPGKPVLADDNGWDNGLMDGSFNINMNMYSGSNGYIYKLYENGVLIDTKTLTPNSPNAQTAVTPISGKSNGAYSYYCELINDYGIATSDNLTVNVTQALPGKPVLSNDNWDGGGNYKIEMNMFWGKNGTAYMLYENGVLIDTQNLADNTPNAQSASTIISNRNAGTYEYYCDLKDSAGVTSSDKMIITVSEGAYEIITLKVKPDGTGDFLSPKLANDSITDSNTEKRYVIEVYPGVYTETNWIVKPYTTIRGTDRDNCWLKGEMPENATNNGITDTSTIWLKSTANLENLKITCKNMRYPVHSEDNGNNKNAEHNITNCYIEHYGNLEAVQYRKKWAIEHPGVTPTADMDPAKVWGGVTGVGAQAWGYGSASGVVENFYNSTFISKSTGWYAHNRQDFTTPQINTINNSKIASTVNSIPIHIQSLGSGTKDQAIFNNCELIGTYITQNDSPWISVKPENQYANHADYTITLNGCTPIGYIDGHRGRALAIFSNSMGSTSYVRVSGTAVNDILGKYTTKDGGGTLKGYIYGYWDISGIKVGLFSDTVVNNTLGRRLGNCSIINKSLNITFEDGTTKSIVFNEDYANQTNAYVLEKINNILGSKGTAVEYNVTDNEYYPQVPDKQMTMTNNTNVGIPRFSAVCYNSDSQSIRLMKSTDTKGMFVGITLEGIAPGQSGRVLTEGLMRRAQLNGLSGNISVGTKISISSQDGCFAISTANPTVAEGVYLGWAYFKGNTSGTLEDTVTLTVKPDGTGDYLSPKLANDSIIDSSTEKRYVIEVYPGVYTETNWTVKPYTTIRGTDRDNCWLKGEKPESATNNEISGTSTIGLKSTANLENLKITCKNMLYPVISADSGKNINAVHNIENCYIEHYGNLEAVQYRQKWAIEHPGVTPPADLDPAKVAGGVTGVGAQAWGYGSASGVVENFFNSTFISKFAGWYAHNREDFTTPQINTINDCRIASTVNSTPIIIQSNGSGTKDQAIFNNCELEGVCIAQNDSPWISQKPENQYANHADYSITLNNCTPVGYIDGHRGRALAIFSNSTGSTSYVRASGNAVNDILGQYTTKDGGGTLKGYIYGYWDISGIKVGPSSNITVNNTLGRRLGNCTITNKTLNITFEDGTIKSIVFNEDYTNQNNAYILGKINNVLGSSGSVVEYNVTANEYYPQVIDKQMTMTNNTSIGIPRFSAVCYNSDSKSIRLMKSTDSKDSFLGITLEGIAPGQSGRVLTEGIMHKTQLNGFSGSIAVGTQISISSKDGCFAINMANPTVMQGIRTDWAYFKGNTVGAFELLNVTANKTLIKTGDTTSLTLTGIMSNGTAEDMTKAQIVYTSDNEQVAAVTQNGDITASGEGIAKITVAVKIGGITKEAEIQITVDGTPAVTTSDISGTKINGWYTGDVVITLASSDNLSGVEKTEYRLSDSVNFIIYTAPVTITQDGNHIVQCHSTDKAGNIEEVKQEIVKVDKSAPVSAATVSGTVYSDGTYNSHVVVVLTSEDAAGGSGVTGIQYSMDGINWMKYTGPLELNDNGIYSLSYKATDNAGNIETIKNVSIIVSMSPEVMTAYLKDKVSIMTMEEGIKKSLTSKLDNVLSDIINEGKKNVANKLNAFTNEVDAQIGKKLTAEQVAELKSEVNKIVKYL